MVEVTGGMGRGRVPKPGTVPELGQRSPTCPIRAGARCRGSRSPMHTPWTHSAADARATRTAPYRTEDAAAEEWGNDS